MSAVRVLLVEDDVQLGESPEATLSLEYGAPRADLRTGPGEDGRGFCVELGFPATS